VRSEGSIADNVVPKACRVRNEFRDLPGTDAAALQRRVEGYAATLTPAMQTVEPTSGFSFDSFAAMSASHAWPDKPASRLAQRLADSAAAPLVWPSAPRGFVPARRHIHRGKRAGLHQAGAPSGSVVSLAQLAPA